MRNIQDLTLTYDLNSKSVTEIQEKQVSAKDAEGLASDPKVTEILNEIHARQDGQMSTILGATGRDLDGRWEELRIEETGMGRLVTAAYLDETGADVAFENAGGIQIGRVLEAGYITWKDVIDTAPYGNYIVTKEITGQDLLDILEKSIEIGRQNKISYDEWKQTGQDVSWPNNSGSYLQFAGIRVQYDMSKPEGQRVVKAQVGSNDLDPAGTYTIATNNYVALGEDFESLKNAPEINQYSACDEALTRFIQKGQSTVDVATAETWLKEVQDENSGSDAGSDSSTTPGNTGTGSDNSSTGSDNTAADYKNTDQKKSEPVKTGDDQNLAVWSILCVLAVSGGAGACIYRKKKYK